ncbi:MAG: hypothetical protein IJL75_00940 [Eubacterium sp.]|nr:hypothetical protein [Eubacterium sp.]
MRIKRIVTMITAVAVIFSMAGISSAGNVSKAADGFEADTLYVAAESSLTVKDSQYVIKEGADFNSGEYFVAGSTTSSVYTSFKYADADGNVKEVDDPKLLTAYYTEYDESIEQDVFEKANPAEFVIEKPYKNSNIMKFSYKGGPIEFSREYVITYSGAQPDENYEKRITCLYGPAVLQETGTYDSTVVGDKSFVKEIKTNGAQDINVYSAVVDTSDMIHWNTINSAELDSVRLTDELGNDLTDLLVEDKNVSLTEDTGRNIIFGDKFVIQKGILSTSATLEISIKLNATGGDGQERTYVQTNRVYIFYSDSAEKQKNPMTLTVSKKTYSAKKDLKKKKTFNIGVKNAKGKVAYTLSKNAKKAKLSVTSKGKVTVPKKCKKGVYNIKVKAAGNDEYKSAQKTVTITVKK